MAELLLNEGATSFDAANWSGGTGFVNDAELAVITPEGQAPTFTDLDRTADAATGIKRLSIRGGRPIVGDDSGDLIFRPKAGYTAEPAFVFSTEGGRCRLQLLDNTADRVVINSATGVVYLVAGTVNKLLISGGCTAYILPGFDVATGLWVQGDAAVEISDGGAGSIPALYATKRCRVTSKRRLDVVDQDHQAVVKPENKSGTNGSQYTLRGGLFVPRAGGWDTIDAWGGQVDKSQIVQALELGATAFNVYDDEFVVPQSAGLLTTSNVAPLFPIRISK